VTLSDAAAAARARLIEAGIQPATATLDASLLARHVLGWDLAAWLARRSEPATREFTTPYEALIARRCRREPVAYIRGVQEFWGREFVVTPAVLIPRPETELLIEHANAYLRDHPHAVVVDVGTGSGCIAVTLALEHRAIHVHAVDISDAALSVARTNASRLGASDRVHLVHGSLLDNVPPPVDLIVANPPYVAERDKPALSPEVREYEPAVALFGGFDGWREIRGLLRAAAEALTPHGLLLVELGYGQSEDLASEVAKLPAMRLEMIGADLQGIPRVAQLRRASH
jgi:release factor glutamine methyltransferase